MLEKALVMEFMEGNLGIRRKKIMRVLVDLLVFATFGLLTYTLFTDGPDLIRGTKTIKSITILKKLCLYNIENISI
ncbi:hypothetical protein EJ73_01964 [Hoylesella shahii DSM 15611 = JCM 12083]|jgi:hypothetical protein|uniref:Uncharacterized protein n=1 Tax=Hoylesella shahii DSM 15611 = JCM 12083 TaxID=1122991 RepID=A0A318HRS2_9BACT|nr:hypothetical protein EJ73_01964 [Hoylesella shahii DSM 15611 = JCM 12083]